MLIVRTPLGEEQYSYLLGIYLGDGHVGPHGRTGRLTISCDAGYPGIIREVADAARCVNPDAVVRTHVRAGQACVVVSSYARSWLSLFPQHGPGRKHERAIELAVWQREVVDRFPEAFLRGLIHSDGCRTVNRFFVELPSGRTVEYEYVRYFFSNLSVDIRRLFCEYCDRLDIRWTQSNRRNISVSHGHSVSRLDRFVGNKA